MKSFFNDLLKIVYPILKNLLELGTGFTVLYITISDFKDRKRKTAPHHKGRSSNHHKRKRF